MTVVAFDPGDRVHQVVRDYADRNGMRMSSVNMPSKFPMTERHMFMPTDNPEDHARWLADHIQGSLSKSGKIRRGANGEHVLCKVHGSHIHTFKVTADHNLDRVVVEHHSERM